jgi:hypothetical protein
LKLSTIFHDEHRCHDFSDERRRLHQLDSLNGRNLRLDATTADQRAGRDCSLHQSILAYDDLPLGQNFAVETAIDPHRPFNMDLAFQHYPFGQEGNVIISGKAITFHASFPPSRPIVVASLHYSS